MSATTDFQNISLYIPHIFANFSKEFVAAVFEDLNIGNVKNIDFVSKCGQDGKEYNAAYIHFNEWYDTISARNFQARVLDTTKEARVVYDEPWYWIVLENKARKHVPGERKPRIDLGTPAISKATPAPAPKTVVSSTPAPKKYTDTEVINLNKAPAKALTKKADVSVMAPVKLETEFAAVEQPLKTPMSLKEDLAWVDELLNEEKEKYAYIEAQIMAMDEEEMMDDIEEFMAKEEEMMDDIDALMEEDDQYLIQIDSRYVQTLEEENQNLQTQIASLQNQLAAMTSQYWVTESAFRTEQVKSQALAEVIQMLKK